MRIPGGDQMVHGQAADMRLPGGDQLVMVHGQAAGHEDTWRRLDGDGTRAGSRTQGYLEEIRWYTGRQPDTRIPGGDQMVLVHGQAAVTRIPGGDQMVHGQAARHKDTRRRSDGTRAGSRTRGYQEEIRWYTGGQPDTRIPGGDRMVHGQAARYKDTRRRSDGDGTRAGSRTRGYLEEIRW